MKRCYKICLICALFFFLASGVFAGFNYDSARNYFLIDSILKMQGNIISVGSALNESLKKEDGTANTNFFGVSNNLIFMNKEGKFVSGPREFNKDFFQTLGITYKPLNQSADHDLLIMPIGGAGSLNLEANNLRIYQNFRIKNGLALDGREINKIEKNTLYVNRIDAQTFNLLTPALLNLSLASETIFSINFSAQLTADEIKFDNQNFCQRETWDTSDDSANGADSATRSLEEQSYNCDGNRSQCCDINYFVFTIDANNGKMICCQAASGPLPFY